MKDKNIFIMYFVMIMLFLIASQTVFSLVYRNDTAPQNIFFNNSNYVNVNNTVIINITNNITNNIYINNTQEIINNFTTVIDLNLTSLKIYLDAFYYSTTNPNEYINKSAQLLDYYNKSYIDSTLLLYLTLSEFTNENTSIWNMINLKLNESDQRYNDTALINSISFNMSSAIYDNISYVNTSLINMINNVNTSVWQNISDIYINFLRYADNNYLYTAAQTVFFNETKLNNTILSVSSVYNDTKAINSVSDNLSAINQTFNYVDYQLRNAFLENDTTNFIILNNSINTKVSLNGNSIITGNIDMLGNLSILGRLIIYNSTQTNYNSSLIIKDAFGVTQFNATYGNVYIGSYLKVNGDINATNINAFVDSSYILNPYWLNITDQRYNDTALINSVSANMSLITGWNISQSKYLINVSSNLYVNESMLNITVNSRINNYLLNQSPANFSNIAVKNINISQNMTLQQTNRICFDAACTRFMCVNSTNSMIISNNRTGVSCG